MLDLRRLRLLRELEGRGTIAAVAEALAYTPSAVSQQLAVLEREAGVPLLERAGRGVRLTDAGRALAAHAGRVLDEAARAEAVLAAAAGTAAGRVRVAAFQSALLRLVVPALDRLATDAPELRAEVVEAEPEPALEALALGDLDVVVADEWAHQPRPRTPGLTRHHLADDAIRLVLPQDHPLAARHAARVPLAELRDAAWTTGHPGTGYAGATVRACRELGGFEPDVRHRANDVAVLLLLVAGGRAVTVLPDFVRPERHAGVAVRDIAEGTPTRQIFAVSRTTDRGRPALDAVLSALDAQARA